MRIKLPPPHKIVLILIVIVAGAAAFTVNPTAQQPAPPTLPAPMPHGFRGVQPPVAGTEALPRGVESAATPEPYVPTWGVVYADDFDATNLQRRWDVDISPFIALEGDNRYQHLTQPDTLLSLGGYASGVRLKARVRLLDGSFAVGLRKGNVGRYQTEFFADGRVVLSRNDTTTMAVAAIEPTG